MRMRKALLLQLFVLSMAATYARGYEPAGARVQGMGGAGVALPSDVTTVFWNPAGLFFHDGIALDLTFSFEELSWPRNWGFSYLNYSRSGKSGAGFGLYRIEDSWTTEGGDAVAAILSTVYRTPIGLPLGVSFKYINENWADQGRTSYFSGDLGIFLPYGSWLLGACIQSVTRPGSQLFPYRVLLGLSWGLRRGVTAGFQMNVTRWEELDEPDQAELRAGVNLQFSGAFSAQGGWARTVGEEYWTGGIGLRGGGGASLHVAYHYYTKGDCRDRLFLSYSYYLP